MPNIGPLELAVILVIALVVFGPKRLPELGKSLGKGIREFKESLSMDDTTRPRTAGGITDESLDSGRSREKSPPQADDKG